MIEMAALQSNNLVCRHAVHSLPCTHYLQRQVFVAALKPCAMVRMGESSLPMRPDTLVLAVELVSRRNLSHTHSPGTSVMRTRYAEARRRTT